MEGDLVLVEGEEAGVAEDDAPVAVVAGEKEGGGTPYAYFTGTRVKRMTQKALGAEDGLQLLATSV